ncbi:MAG: xanthine dehydrogenase family protein subunit M [Candidatus Dormibacteraeota bacterium]|nr:xanthine dehydrogenase family protein subunit M [Candidatus Dormibacteraeota bacterium]MBO0703678.1 xanthine dehydrogenase family protein subunit M [Candidatus Dormibacteraeota bacterium]MBO0759637.1 xanthine dehydrogenase family protein subunit M [Candidatus Dormibacteraeota bacterium]
MPKSIRLLEAPSVQDAVAALTHYGEEAKVVAGGTAVTLMLRQGLIQPAALVSIARIPGLREISSDEGQLRLGALVTHREVESSRAALEALPVLASTFGKVANVRVRNAATVGGVLAEADYASDPPCVFAALDAGVEITGDLGTRTVPVADFFRGYYETVLAPNELVTGVRVPLLQSGTGAVYTKFQTRSSEDRPCVGVFAAVRVGADRRCEELRVAVGAATELPLRLREVEAAALGRPVTDRVAREVADHYAEAANPISDLRGSSWYRKEMIRVWVRRAILAGADRAA